MEPKEFRLMLGDKELVIETGKLAKQCNGSATARLGDTVVLATATLAKEARPGINFLPLMVNYQEKMYASGMIKSSRFVKRETRPSDEKILMGRVIDRTLRPLFPKYFYQDIQVILTTLSYDQENEHDMIAAIAASAALSISDIPFEGPTATVRVGLINGEFVLNPSPETRKKSDLDLIVSSSPKNVVMIEAGAKEVPEAKMLEAIAFGKKWGQKICSFIQEIQKAVGKKKREFPPASANETLTGYIEKNYTSKIETVLFETAGKLARYEAFRGFSKEVEEHFEKEMEGDEALAQIDDLVDNLVKKIVRKNILENEKRMGGRKLNQIRSLNIQVGFLPRTHGSGLFERGETQGLTTCTLGSPGDVQILEGIEGESKKRYFHHYNFPPFSVGETSNRLFPGNREIGHGALAERAIEPLLPSKEEFPYTIRTVTEILGSNGSSSMAATCGSALALMDAGVPIKKMVAGIAMGLMTDPASSNYKILTDLQDEEDMGGDMDFKVTGTRDGITAIQMDIKIKGLSEQIFTEALEKARQGRMEILDAMEKVIAKPRAELSKYAPRLITLHVNPEKIRFIIGPGGEVINKIIAECGVDVDIEDDGTVVITTKQEEGGRRAQEWIEGIVAEPEEGKIYKNCKVTRLLEFGALCEFMPGKEGMIHVSEIAEKFVENIADHIKLGQIVNVKLKEVDVQNNRFRLSIKGVPQPIPEKK
ncbi:polyribonucleotide nucleotidyltransferase [Candidatus Peregrinibacteria bacterium]|nr:polyribonucleotide nucleotidyltransferase [Candidatus Peregrinibacteria bacterium]